MENLQEIDAGTSLGTANGSSEAERLMAKAKAIRDSIPTTNEQPAGSDVSIGTSATHQDTKQSIYSLPPDRSAWMTRSRRRGLRSRGRPPAISLA